MISVGMCDVGGPLFVSVHLWYTSRGLTINNQLIYSFDRPFTNTFFVQSMLRSFPQRRGHWGVCEGMHSLLWRRWMTRVLFEIMYHLCVRRRLRGDDELSAERMIAVPTTNR